jgi:hypothetical protein
MARSKCRESSIVRGLTVRKVETYLKLFLEGKEVQTMQMTNQVVLLLLLELREPF